MNRYKNVFRFTFAIIFLVGAIANTIILFLKPEAYRGFAELSFFPLFRTLWADLVSPSIHLFVGFTVILEMTFAVILVVKGMAVRIGLFLAASFMLFLFPFWWSGGSTLNLAFALILLWLSSFSYPLSMKELFNGWRKPRL
jgi:hypothetical protein